MSVTGVSASNLHCDHLCFISCFSLAVICCWWGIRALGNVQANNQRHQPVCFNCQLCFGGGAEHSSAEPNVSFSISFKSMWCSFMAFCKECKFHIVARYLTLHSLSLDSVQTHFGNYFWVVWNKLVLIFSPKITDLVGPHAAQQNRSVNTLGSWFPNPWKYKYIQSRGTKQVQYRIHILYNCHLSHCSAVHVGSWLSALYHYDEWSAPSCQAKWWL